MPETPTGGSTSGDRWLPVFIWSVLIAFLTLTPQPLPPVLEGARGVDLLGHFFLFGVLTLLVLRAASAERPTTRTLLICALLLIASALDEWAQSHIKNRYSSWADLGADVAAILSVSLVWRFASVRTAEDAETSKG